MPIRDRLACLDALRAIAAAIVVVHHAGPMLFGSMLLPRGYLAVDFFFMLSGFVMAHAYDDRLREGLSGTAMLRARIVRLYPTIAIGILAAAAVMLATGSDPVQTLFLLTTCLLFIPVATAPDNAIFLLDGVQWSLLFELVANGAHTRLYRLSDRSLALLTGIAALATVAACRAHGSLGIGDVAATFAGGLVRVAFPYLSGMLLHRLYRSGALTVTRIDARGCAVVLCALLSLPAATLWWADAAVVILAFPMLLANAVRARTEGMVLTLSEVGGRLSYPLYALHLPALSATVALATASGLKTGALPMFAGCAAALLLAIATHALLHRRPWRASPWRSRAKQSLLHGWRTIIRADGALR
ncbi:acyltransferase family protein [Sphingomonas jatrophae]|uniref:Peptidoglycan/LPS O-acetylase OafA/YrhL, contains acyltransferase and SGNH-hydrolase domains n=1 Tax=Sphingomonas jatrophae TaxID=1166337 RepID=A0A1I6K4L3_9SPHN|nr:acyltransferase [Sphingomonas jatrophae]SFR86172.1 Peptidoglycan/LPS O-acetylase OafA/YrhL, contains acyltransferase and SGNH-hydrolase domains [Sphingomonas jatrophae]